MADTPATALFAPPLRGSGRPKDAQHPPESRGGYALSTLANAREMRKNLTDAERRLWFAINRKQIHGLRFRRQQPVGPYIADFYCAAARLIIELDGGQHAERILDDETRTTFFQKRGYKVLRFWNHEVLSEFNSVLRVIAESARPHASADASAAPPQGGSKAVSHG